MSDKIELDADKLTEFLHEATLNDLPIKVTLPNLIMMCKMMEKAIKQLEWVLLEMQKKEIGSVDEAIAQE